MYGGGMHNQYGGGLGGLGGMGSYGGYGDMGSYGSYGSYGYGGLGGAYSGGLMGSYGGLGGYGNGMYGAQGMYQGLPGQGMYGMDPMMSVPESLMNGIQQQVASIGRISALMQMSFTNLQIGFQSIISLLSTSSFLTHESSNDIKGFVSDNNVDKMYLKMNDYITMSLLYPNERCLPQKLRIAVAQYAFAHSIRKLKREERIRKIQAEPHNLKLYAQDYEITPKAPKYARTILIAGLMMSWTAFRGIVRVLLRILFPNQSTSSLSTAWSTSKTKTSFSLPWSSLIMLLFQWWMLKWWATKDDPVPPPPSMMQSNGMQQQGMQPQSMTMAMQQVSIPGLGPRKPEIIQPQQQQSMAAVAAADADTAP